jgi:hypothetical protein
VKIGRAALQRKLHLRVMIRFAQFRRKQRSVLQHQRRLPHNVAAGRRRVVHRLGRCGDVFVGHDSQSARIDAWQLHNVRGARGNVGRRLRFHADDWQARVFLLNGAHTLPIRFQFFVYRY